MPDMKDGGMVEGFGILSFLLSKRNGFFEVMIMFFDVRISIGELKEIVNTSHQWPMAGGRTGTCGKPA